jgi:hypothetical protein
MAFVLTVKTLNAGIDNDRFAPNWAIGAADGDRSRPAEGMTSRFNTSRSSRNNAAE